MTVTYHFDPIGRSSWGPDLRLMTSLVLGQYESQVMCHEDWRPSVLAALGTDWRSYQTRDDALEGHRAWVKALNSVYELRNVNPYSEETTR
jgi:hypothetical protein